MPHPLNLDTLLIALREAGVHIGITEVMRLQQVFARWPECVQVDPQAPTQRRLRILLRAILVKSQEDGAVFERVCDHWLTQAEHEVQMRSAPVAPAPAFPAGTAEPLQRLRRKRRWRDTVMPLAVLMLLSTVLSPWTCWSKAYTRSAHHICLSVCCAATKKSNSTAQPLGASQRPPDGGHLSLLASTCQVVYTGVSLTSI